MPTQKLTDTFNMYTIAGGFPPTVNSFSDATTLRADESPLAYGVDCTVSGVLKKSTTITAKTAFNRKTITTVSNYNSKPFYWMYNRLWSICNLTSSASQILAYGAQQYNDMYFAQGLGKIPYDQTSQNIVCITPFGSDLLLVSNSSGSYVLSNCADGRGYFQQGEIIQQLAVDSASSINVVDGQCYIITPDGKSMYAFDGRNMKNVIVPITDLVTAGTVALNGTALTADYPNRRLYAGTAMVYDIGLEKIFLYNSTFSVKTRQFHLPDWAPFMVDRLIFVVKHETTEDGVLKYKIKFEDDPWSEEYTVNIRSSEDEYSLVEDGLADARQVRKLQIELTDLSVSKSLREIRLDAQAFNMDDYSE